LEGRSSPLHPLDMMEAEDREFRAEGHVDDLVEAGVSYAEVLEGLGGFEEAERIFGTDYARYLQEEAVKDREHGSKSQKGEN
jgi:hypothetical protein